MKENHNSMYGQLSADQLRDMIGEDNKELAIILQKLEEIKIKYKDDQAKLNTLNEILEKNKQSVLQRIDDITACLASIILSGK